MIAPQSRSRLTLFALCVGLATSSTAFAAGDHADDLLQQGMKLADAGKANEARQKIAEAWQLKQSYDIAANLALVETELGDDAAAAEHFDYARKTFPAQGKAESRARLDAALAAAKAKAACFRIRVNVDGARLKLAERDLGTSPLSSLICAKPGASTLSVSRDGYKSSTRQLDGAAGSDAPLEVILEPLGSSDVGSGGAAGSSTTSSSGAGLGGSGGEGGGTVAPLDEKPMWPAIVLGSVAAVGLGVGIAGVVVGTGKHSDAEDLTGTCDPSACKPDVNDLLGEANTFVGLGIAGFSVAGAAAIGTVIYLVVPAASTTSAFRLAPGPGTAGLSLSTSF